MNLNQIQIIGRLTHEPEIRQVTTANGEKSVVSLSIAVNREFDKEKADFLKITIWGASADNFAKFTKKGNLIFAQGRLEFETDKKDETKRHHNIIVDKWKLLTPKAKDGQAPAETNSNNNGGMQQVDDDNLPF